MCVNTFEQYFNQKIAKKSGFIICVNCELTHIYNKWYNISVSQAKKKTQIEQRQAPYIQYCKRIGTAV